MTKGEKDGIMGAQSQMGYGEIKEKENINAAVTGERVILKERVGEGESAWYGILFKGYNGHGQLIFIKISRGKFHRANKKVNNAGNDELGGVKQQGMRKVSLVHRPNFFFQRGFLSLVFVGLWSLDFG